ncbi:UNVERIFIED_CONTAM: hypothetical protein FKN15_062921 [Acipenser sinensis]
MGEAIVVEQFCHVVSAKIQAWIRRHNPDALEEAVKLAEDFKDSLVSTKTGLLTAPVQRSSRAPPPLSTPPALGPGPRPSRPPTPMGNLTSSSWRPRLTPIWGRFAVPALLPQQQWDRYLTTAPSVPPTCFRCHQPGHQARSCPSAVESDMAAIRHQAIPAPLNIPNMWASSADLVWGQSNNLTLVHAWEQVY